MSQTSSITRQQAKIGMGTVTINLDGQGRVLDSVTGKVLKKLEKSPEEPVRQWYEQVLMNELSYSKEEIDIEIPIQMGSATKKADIVVYEDGSKARARIIIETKKPDKHEGVTQLHSYMEATGTEFGVWTNGTDISYWYHPNPQEFEPLGRILSRGETVHNIGAELHRFELKPAHDLVSDFQSIEQYVLSHQGGIDVFDEVFKIIFAKIYDEKKNLKQNDSLAEFRAGIQEPASSVRNRLERLFAGAKALYPDVIASGDSLQAEPQVTKWIVSLLQKYILTETDMDVLGVGFEVLVNPKMKSDKGQYFTPRQVVRAAVEMVNVDEEMRLLDPACGSGGFLIFAMEKVWSKIDREWANQMEALHQKLQFAQQKVFGLDYDDRLTRVAKAYMAIWGDGRSHIYHTPCSIRSYEWQGELADQVKDESFDAVLTNPPFAGDLSMANIAHRFDLGLKRGRPLNEQRKDILFVERAIKSVKKANSINDRTGYVAIVLPKGDLDEIEKQYVRDYILENTVVVAIISLDRLTFVPFTSQKTSLVILKRMEKNKIPREYEIFMAVSRRSGKDKSGNLRYVTNGDGLPVLDEFGRPVVDTDLVEIASDFRHKVAQIGFWIKRSRLEGRLNAEYYDPSLMAERNQIVSGPHVELSNLVDPNEGILNGKDISAIGNSGKRQYAISGVPYLRVGDVKENEIDTFGSEKIDPHVYDLASFRRACPGDLLITRKGTTGRTAVLTVHERDVILSSEIIRVRIKTDLQIDGDAYHISPYYIAAFLNSNHGRKIVTQKQTGGISEGINQQDLRRIEIPLLTQAQMNRIAVDYALAAIRLRSGRYHINNMIESFGELMAAEREDQDGKG